MTGDILKLIFKAVEVGGELEVLAVHAKREWDEIRGAYLGGGDDRFDAGSASIVRMVCDSARRRAKMLTEDRPFDGWDRAAQELLHLADDIEHARQAGIDAVRAVRRKT